MDRIRLRLEASGGVKSGDTGHLNGELRQIQFVPDAADTGQSGTITLTFVPTSDTGLGGKVVYTEAGLNLGVASDLKHPFREVYDTGTRLEATPIVGVGERLIARVTPADTGVVVSGSLYGWVA